MKIVSNALLKTKVVLRTIFWCTLRAVYALGIVYVVRRHNCTWTSAASPRSIFLLDNRVPNPLYPGIHLYNNMTNRPTIIVAAERRNGIGIANRLPWKLAEDMAHFKATTMGSTVIMGRKTFESIGRPLPGRRNIVISRSENWAATGVDRASSVEEACHIAENENAYIIGGSQIYLAALELAGAIELTRIDHDFDCDTFFPQIDNAVWQETSRTPGTSQVKPGDPTQGTHLNYAFIRYERRLEV